MIIVFQKCKLWDVRKALFEFYAFIFRDALDNLKMDLKSDYDCASKDDRDNEDGSMDTDDVEAKDVSFISICALLIFRKLYTSIHLFA